MFMSENKYLKYIIGISFIIGLITPVDQETDHILYYIIIPVIPVLIVFGSIKIINRIRNAKSKKINNSMHFIGWFFLSVGFGQFLSSLIFYTVLYPLAIISFFMGLSFLLCVRI